eukprot:GHVP01019889.1.p2 GENE.GHVP01019889.1~~GHVP01019889.1.p2  ORF type:complete len:426 (+),score=49.91 GHVP01019889.1:2177-3454(+)
MDTDLKHIPQDHQLEAHLTAFQHQENLSDDQYTTAIKTYIQYRKTIPLSELLSKLSLLPPSKIKESLASIYGVESSISTYETDLPGVYLSLFLLHNEDAPHKKQLMEAILDVLLLDYSENKITVKITKLLINELIKGGLYETNKEKIYTLLSKQVLVRNIQTQAVIVNGLLREAYITNNILLMKELSKVLVMPSETTFFRKAEYFYYMARINIIEQRYQEAYEKLTSALIMIPNITNTLGFRQHLTKLYLIVSLLNNKIPKRSIFNGKHMKRSLNVYFGLIISAILGDVKSFQETIEKNKEELCKDGNYLICTAIENYVIRNCLDRIINTYSVISIKKLSEVLSLNIDNIEKLIANRNMEMDKDWIYIKNHNKEDYHEKYKLNNGLIKSMELLSKCKKSMIYKENNMSQERNDRDVIMDSLISFQ